MYRVYIYVKYKVGFLVIQNFDILAELFEWIWCSILSISAFLWRNGKAIVSVIVVELILNLSLLLEWRNSIIAFKWRPFILALEFHDISFLQLYVKILSMVGGTSMTTQRCRSWEKTKLSLEWPTYCSTEDKTRNHDHTLNFVCRSYSCWWLMVSELLIPNQVSFAIITIMKWRHSGFNITETDHDWLYTESTLRSFLSRQRC